MNDQPSASLPTGATADAAAARKFSKARPLAARFGLHAKTIFRWADAGKIHRFKVNERVVLFDEAEVLAFVEAARVA